VKKKRRYYTVSFTTEISVQATGKKDAEEKLREEVEASLGEDAERNLMDIEVDEASEKL